MGRALAHKNCPRKPCCLKYLTAASSSSPLYCGSNLTMDPGKMFLALADRCVLICRPERVFMSSLNHLRLLTMPPSHPQCSKFIVSPLAMRFLSSKARMTPIFHEKISWTKALCSSLLTTGSSTTGAVERVARRSYAGLVDAGLSFRASRGSRSKSSKKT